MSIARNAAVWARVSRALGAQPPGTVLRVPKWQYPHPVDSGAHVSIGLPMGQSADFRWRLPGCAGLHVRDFGSHYEAHVDQVDPSCDPVEHARRDAPEVFLAGAGAIGAMIGAFLGRSSEATLVGAGLGALLGIAALPDGTRPSTTFGVATPATRLKRDRKRGRSRGRWIGG